jgi:hypothetical protein
MKLPDTRPHVRKNGGGYGRELVQASASKARIMRMILLN